MSETREDRLMAALGHFSVIFFFFGAFVPLILWATQKDRSPFLRRQSLQAMIYQGIGLVAYILYMVIFSFAYLLAFIPMMVLADSAPNMDEGAAIFMLVVFAVIMIAGMFMSLLVLLYYILAVIAAWRTLKGRDFNYPIIGRLVRHTPITTAAVPDASGTAPS